MMGVRPCDRREETRSPQLSQTPFKSLPILGGSEVPPVGHCIDPLRRTTNAGHGRSQCDWKSEASESFAYRRPRGPCVV